MKHRSIVKRLLVVLLSVFMIVTLLPVVGLGEKVDAATGSSRTVYETDGVDLPLLPFDYDNGIHLPDDDDEDVVTETAWDKTVYGISTTGISDPRRAGNTRHDWLGDFVWYGQYDGEPVKYRVLNSNTTKYGGNTLFLDCDSILYEAAFASTTNDWANSALKEGLNGNKFLTKSYGFTPSERAAIVNSYAPAHDLQEGRWTVDLFEKFVAINGEKIFLLDAEEADEALYGYRWSTNDDRETYTRRKMYKGTYSDWWLRSAYGSENGSDSRAGLVSSGGYVKSGRVPVDYGVSPAFNVDRSSILFSSLVKEQDSYGHGSEYKLTLIESDIELSLFATGRTPAVSGKMNSEGTLVISAHFKLSTNLIPNYISFFILDQEFAPGNANEASILYYTKYALPEDYGQEIGSASFRLPSEFDPREWGKSYYVYMVAESVGDIYDTDYASEPVKLSSPQINYLAPWITEQPEDARVIVGDVAEFSVEAMGSGTLTYQWQSRKNESSEWVNSGQSGAKTPTLSVKSNSGLNGYQFQCIVSQTNGKTKTSDPVTMTVIPRIKSNPQDTYAKAGTTAKFTVSAEGKATLTYQWQSRKNYTSEWVNSGQSGARTATLSVATNAGLNGYQFRCIVKDGNEQINTSLPATLWISPLIT
ncbi:MAG: hypothetical protein J6T47_08580, partial [Lachnospiraceae bacterium]|nr:hypothetical protein [Lachnospiraceae bacterium]